MPPDAPPDAPRAAPAPRPAPAPGAPALPQPPPALAVHPAAAYHASYAGLAPLYHPAALPGGLQMAAAPHQMALHKHAVVLPHALAAAALPGAAGAHQLYQQQMQMMAASAGHGPYAFAAHPMAHTQMQHHFQRPVAPGSMGAGPARSGGSGGSGGSGSGGSGGSGSGGSGGSGSAGEQAGGAAPMVTTGRGKKRNEAESREKAQRNSDGPRGGEGKNKSTSARGVEKRRRRQLNPLKKLPPDADPPRPRVSSVVHPASAVAMGAPNQPPPPSQSLAFVNGRFVAMCDAQVSITDLGFTYGCAVVEDILLLNGFGVRVDAHLEYLATAARALNLPLPLSVPDLRSICAHVVTTNRDGGARGALHIQLSYGAYAARTRRLPPPASIVPSLVIHTQPLPPIPPAYRERGIALFPTHDDNPSLYAPGEPPVPYKSSSQLPALLALQDAIANECEEALLSEPLTGDVTGTTNGHIFCVKFGIVYTPPAVGKVSDCVMRRCILDACREKLDIEAREVSITQPFLCSATEVFCASVLDLVVPVRAVGDRTIGEGVPGPVTSKIMEWLSDPKTALAAEHGSCIPNGGVQGAGGRVGLRDSGGSRERGSSSDGQNSGTNSGSDAMPAPPPSSSPNESRGSSDGIAVAGSNTRVPRRDRG